MVYVRLLNNEDGDFREVGPFRLVHIIFDHIWAVKDDEDKVLVAYFDEMKDYWVYKEEDSEYLFTDVVIYHD